MPEQATDLVEVGEVKAMATPTSYNDLLKLADAVTSTALCPAAYKGKPKDAAVAMMMATEVGINPVTALNYIQVVNGRPAWYADALPGIAKARGMVQGYKEYFEGEFPNDDFAAVCEVTAADGTVYANRFSIQDAKTARLWSKQGPWTLYPKRMLQWRARSWAIRDAVPEMLFGVTVEELQDENARHRGPERAKPINIDTDAAPHKIITITTPVAEEPEPSPETEPDGPDTGERAEEKWAPKAKLKDVIMELTDTDSFDVVRAYEVMLDEKRDSMSAPHIGSLERAIAEAKTRLDNAAMDSYAEESGDPFDEYEEADA